MRDNGARRTRIAAQAELDSAALAGLGTAIPHLLHQTYPSLELPGALRRNVDNLRAANPSWDHRLYDDASIERFVLEHYGPAMLAYYARIDPAYGAARADLFRYLAVYRLGGVYLDVKSTFVRPIDETIKGDEHYILSGWRNRAGEPHAGFGMHGDLAGLLHGEFQQWHVIAAPRHPFLRAVIGAVLDGIDRYGPRRTGIGYIGVLRLTGPIAYTRAISPLLDSHPCTIVADETAVGLAYSVLEKSSHQGFFRSHYTRNTAPVVRRPGLPGRLDRTYVRARNLKHRLLADST